VIATRTITKKDLLRAAEINDAIALEFNTSSEATTIIGRQLGVDVLGAAVMGAEHARRRFPGNVKRKDAIEAVAHAFTMGVVVGLRAVEVADRP
jgi:hypothetical protein